MVILSLAWGRYSRAEKDSAIPGPICKKAPSRIQLADFIEFDKLYLQDLQKVADTPAQAETLLTKISDKIGTYADHQH
jgi:hypothetical protein